MSVHPDLTAGRVARLRAGLGLPPRPPGPDSGRPLLPAGAAAPAQGADASPTASPTASATASATASPTASPAASPAAGARAKAALRAGLRRVLAPVAGPLLNKVADSVAWRAVGRFEERLSEALADRVDPLARRLDATDTRLELCLAQIRALVPAIDALTAVDANAHVLVSGRKALDELPALTVNLELLKAQLLAYERTLELLGRAIAPDAGLPAAPARLAEQRAQLNRLERSLRGELAALAAQARPGETPVAEPAGEPPRGALPTEVAFDYVDFERRFRGDPAQVLDLQRGRYLDLLRHHQPVLDVGCGRGELLEVLRAEGIEGSGIDLDAGMVEVARAKGLDVHRADVLAHLRSLPEGSLGAVVSLQVIEHLPFEVLVEFVDLAVSRLRPGGLFVAETPNPTALIVLGHSYILDPSHVWPIHPSLAAFLCERAGFADVRVEFFSPADYYRLSLVDAGPEAPPWVATINQALERLNTVLFGPQDYAVIATTPRG
ncbi:MAG: methyltransferase domain-containing protein [Acidimicrobiales bacterium]|nr:methyltransferase domain-containing protein [Acidimicrobiales bacterium]